MTRPLIYSDAQHQERQDIISSSTNVYIPTSVAYKSSSHSTKYGYAGISQGKQVLGSHSMLSCSGEPPTTP